MHISYFNALMKSSFLNGSSLVFIGLVFIVRHFPQRFEAGEVEVLHFDTISHTLTLRHLAIFFNCLNEITSARVMW